MARREFEACFVIGGRREIDIRVVRDGLMLVNAGHNLFILMRAGDGEDFRIFFCDFLGRCAHAAGDNHAAVFIHGIADGLERFGFGGIEEAARIHDNEVGALGAVDKFISFRPQLGHDAFRIHQRLRAAERDQPDFRGGRGL